MRFGFTPLYLSLEDVDQAVDILARIMRERLWDTPEFKQRKAVT
jgi:kynureninase